MNIFNHILSGRWLTNELNTKHEVLADDVNEEINKLLDKCKNNNKVR